MIVSRTMPLLLLIGACICIQGQEVSFVDLTVVEQRTVLRHPPAPPPVCEDGKGCTMSGGIGGTSVGCGAPDRRDPHALAISVLRVGSTAIDPDRPFEAEFQVLNSGRVPIDLPVSPHLSDLQPADESFAFSYFSLALVIRIEREDHQQDLGSVGFVALYGSPDHPGTMVSLKPGEWVRVKANVTLQLRPRLAGPTAAHFRSEFWLRKNTFTPHPGGEFTSLENLYPNTTPTASLAVYLDPSGHSIREED